jgi:hypothetical protein
VCVISQAVEQLRAISLRIDRLQLSVLDVFLSFRCLHRLSRDVQATATLPNSSHAGQWTQVVQRVDDHLRRLNINIGSVGRHRCLPYQLRAFLWWAMPSNSCGRNKGVEHPAHVDSLILS